MSKAFAIVIKKRYIPASSICIPAKAMAPLIHKKPQGVLRILAEARLEDSRPALLIPKFHHKTAAFSRNHGS
jgi:hypothetical protein